MTADSYIRGRHQLFTSPIQQDWSGLLEPTSHLEKGKLIQDPPQQGRQAGTTTDHHNIQSLYKSGLVLPMYIRTYRLCVKMLPLLHSTTSNSLRTWGMHHMCTVCWCHRAGLASWQGQECSCATEQWFLAPPLSPPAGMEGRMGEGQERGGEERRAGKEGRGTCTQKVLDNKTWL